MNVPYKELLEYTKSCKTKVKQQENIQELKTLIQQKRLSPEGVLPYCIQNFNGIMLNANHNDENYFLTLIKMIPALAKDGLKTLFIELPLEDAEIFGQMNTTKSAAEFENYRESRILSTAAAQIPALFYAFLKVHLWISEPFFPHVMLFQTCLAHGIQIFPIDLIDTSMTLENYSSENRITSEQAMKTAIEKHNENGKYMILSGSVHAGLAIQLGIPSVMVRLRSIGHISFECSDIRKDYGIRRNEELNKHYQVVDNGTVAYLGFPSQSTFFSLQRRTGKVTLGAGIAAVTVATASYFM